MTNNLITEFISNLMETLRALNIIDENQMQSENNKIHQNYEHKDKKMLTMRGECDPLVELLLK